MERASSCGPNQVEHLAAYLRDYQGHDILNLLAFCVPFTAISHCIFLFYLQFVFQPAQVQTHRLPARTEEGIAIFSKYPILSHDYLLLPRYSIVGVFKPYIVVFIAILTADLGISLSFAFAKFRNKADIADSHQRILLHAEIWVPQLGTVRLPWCFIDHINFGVLTL